ncbi:MAG: hypothetical protein WC302_03555 [Candidatus Paceibacterota bacterium]|jgi:hypothetical protein
MATLTIFALDIISSEPNFDDFKDQLKAYLGNLYDVEWTETKDNKTPDQLCGATISAVYRYDQIKEMAELIFGQSEEIFTDIIKNVRFKGNGFCPKCGGSNLKNETERAYRFRKEPEPGEYKCLYCEKEFDIN